MWGRRSSSASSDSPPPVGSLQMMQTQTRDLVAARVLAFCNVWMLVEKIIEWAPLQHQQVSDNVVRSTCGLSGVVRYVLVASGQCVVRDEPKRLEGCKDSAAPTKSNLRNLEHGQLHGKTELLRGAPETMRNAAAPVWQPRTCGRSKSRRH